MRGENKDMMSFIAHLAETGLNLFAVLFSTLLGFVALFIIIFFIIDITQARDSVRRNYPVLGRFRNFFTGLGEFFRQYFFSMDREEMPFNRAQRDWINVVSKSGTKTVPFGSTRNLTPGSVIFANSMCPIPDDHIAPSRSALFLAWSVLKGIRNGGYDANQAA